MQSLERRVLDCSLPLLFSSLSNLVTASLSLTSLLAVNQIPISWPTCVSPARACLSVDIPVPSSKFPSRQPPLPPICLLLTSSVPSFRQNTFCPSVNPHHFCSAYNCLSSSYPHTKRHGPQLDWLWNCGGPKGSPTGQRNTAKYLWHAAVSERRLEGGGSAWARWKKPGWKWTWFLRGVITLPQSLRGAGAPRAKWQHKTKGKSVHLLIKQDLPNQMSQNCFFGKTCFKNWIIDEQCNARWCYIKHYL